MFEFDNAEYTKMIEKYQDLDARVIRVMQSDGPEYFSQLNVPTDTTIGTEEFMDLNRMLEKVLQSQSNTFQPHFSRRAWLQTRLEKCLDSVVVACSPLLKANNDATQASVKSNRLGKEMAETRRRYEASEQARRDANAKLGATRSQCSEHLTQIAPYLFQ